MKYLLDLFAIFLMGDALAKLLSLRSHNRLYQFSWAPRFYNRALDRLCTHQGENILLALGMLLTGAFISKRMETEGTRPRIEPIR